MEWTDGWKYLRLSKGQPAPNPVSVSAFRPSSSPCPSPANTDHRPQTLSCVAVVKAPPGNRGLFPRNWLPHPFPIPPTPLYSIWSAKGGVSRLLASCPRPNGPMHSICCSRGMGLTITPGPIDTAVRWSSCFRGPRRLISSGQIADSSFFSELATQSSIFSTTTPTHTTSSPHWKHHTYHVADF